MNISQFNPNNTPKDKIDQLILRYNTKELKIDKSFPELLKIEIKKKLRNGKNKNS